MIKFIHFRNTKGTDTLVKGGKTIAYNEPTDKEYIENAYDLRITYAVAKCHERDNFCRRAGRAKSEGRLHSQRYIKTLEVHDNETVYEAFMRVEGLNVNFE